MPRKENSLPFFLVFFTLSILLILLGTSGLLSGLTSFTNKSLEPVRNATFNLLTLSGFTNKTVEGLTAENQILHSQLADLENLITENKALKDQFAASGSNSISLLPAKVISAPGFIPGESEPSYLVIDKGSADGIRTGSAVVLRNNLVGTVISLQDNAAKVQLETNRSSSFTAKVLFDNKEVDGVAKGQGDSVFLDNVLLSQNLKDGELVLTKGDKIGTSGYPPDLVVGKIVSIEKKPSDLFQKAQVQSFINFKDLSTVFVLLQ